MDGTETVNPSNAVVKAAATPRARIPMSLPVQKLAVPEIPGWHLHWMMGTPSRLAQAQRGGYTFVDDAEVDLNRYGVADSGNSSGNTDLGTRVSVLAGTSSEDGQAARLYLMKIPQELWEEDQAAAEARSEKVAASIRGPGIPDPQGGNENRYVPANAKNRTIFHPKPRGT